MKPVLNLNKHPKNCDNLSLVNAVDAKLSDDLSCLQNENNIIENAVINDALRNTKPTASRIIGCIECNKELIIFATNKTYSLNPINIDIWRYNEDLNVIKKVFSEYKYNGGKIKGTFTYNVNSELIIAISEYDSVVDVPLKTINLGRFPGT